LRALPQKKNCGLCPHPLAFLKESETKNFISGVAAKPRALPAPGSFFEKKEPKKIYNGKLRFPKSVNLANGC